MQLRKTPILLSMTATAALLFGGWFLFQQVNVEQPIRAELEQVTSARVEQLAIDKNQVELTLRVTDPHEFPEQYRELVSTLHQLVPEREVNIHIQNDETPLQEIWNKGLFAMTEAVEYRQYGRIPGMLAQWKQSHGLDEAASRMDERHIYIYLKRGEDDFYAVFPRTGAAAENGVIAHG